MQTKWLSGQIQKVKSANSDYLITGYFTSDNVDSVGDLITKEATEKAVEGFLRFPTLRYMHQPRPIGKVLKVGAPDLEWNQALIKVVDEESKTLIDEGILTALSVGIIVRDAKPNKHGGIDIHAYDWVELSLCDVPANPDAKVTSIQGPEQYNHQATIFKAMDEPTAVQSLLFDKEQFDEEKAVKWAGDHSFENGKVDVTEDKIRLRQFDPAECKPDTYGTKELTDGVQAVFCVRQGKSSDTPTVEDTQLKEIVMDKEKQAGAEIEIPAVETKEEVTKAKEDPLAPAEAQPEKPADKPDEDVSAKLDEVLSLLGEMKKQLDELCAEEPAEDMPEEPKDENLPEKVQAKKTEEVKPEKAAAVEEVKSAKPEQDDLAGIVKGITESLATRDEKLFERMKEYVEELRKPFNGKAALQTEEPKPPKDLVKMTQEERRAELKAKLSQAFKS